MPRDWNAERQQLAEAFTQLEIMKLWLQEHVQSAPDFIEEFKKLNARLTTLGEIDEEGMIPFRIAVDSQRWQQFTKACHLHTGQELSPAEVETRAFNIWCDMIDEVINTHKNHEEDIVA